MFLAPELRTGPCLRGAVVLGRERKYVNIVTVKSEGSYKMRSVNTTGLQLRRPLILLLGEDRRRLGELRRWELFLLGPDIM